jgi:RNA polymerase sigma-70 factor (ECF subfamily)
MPTTERLAEQFEEHRSHVRAVAYCMLGSVSEAEDAVQEAWIRLSRTDVSGVDNLRGWLTTVVARVCLDMLRTRASRREDSLDTHVPDPIIRAIGRREEGVEVWPCSSSSRSWSRSASCERGPRASHAAGGSRRSGERGRV